MTSTQKAAWQTPKLATLDVERTLSGPNFSVVEFFDSDQNLRGGPGSS